MLPAEKAGQACFGIATLIKGCKWGAGVLVIKPVGTGALAALPLKKRDWFM
jgi:hypothetical protein